MILKNIFKHFKTICVHKFWVFHYCKKAGIIWRGIIHDLSKFSPTEFIESIKYYTGTSSPIDSCKKEKGYSLAWIHHKGRNLHHYEAWTDNYDKGTTSIKMPYKYQIEMLCDYLGASHAYNNSFSIENEIKWWENKRVSAVSMHKDSKIFIDVALQLIKTNINNLNSTMMRHLYDYIDKNSINMKDYEENRNFYIDKIISDIMDEIFYKNL